MSDKFEWANAAPWAMIGGAGMLGRITYHARQVQLGKRKPFSLILLWDIPVALTMGWVAFGLATVIKMPWEATVSMALVSSYLGPHAMDIMFIGWSNIKFGKTINVDINAAD